MMNDRNTGPSETQKSPTTPFALIGDADAEICGPDGCAIPADHAAFTDPSTVTNLDSKPDQ